MGCIRSLFSLIVLVGVASGLGGCKSKSPSSTSSTLKIGFILDNLNEERYAKDKAFFEAKAKALGAEVIFASSNSDVSQQMSQVENMISLGVKSLVIQPVDSEACGSIVESAKREGVPVIAYDRIINKAPIDLYVTQDSFLVGVLQAEAAVKATQGKGNYILLSGAEGHSVAEAITAGARSVLNKHPQIHIVTQQYHPGWSTELALKTVENALTKHNNQIDAILANNSGMARGAVQAVAEQKLSGKIFVAGADADLSSIRDITRDRQQFEVLKDIKPLAESAAEAAVLLAKGETVKHDTTMNNQSGREIPVIHTPVYPVTKDNLEAQIIETGFHKREDIFGGK